MKCCYICRRHKIKTNWKFDCCCHRCKDKTELGTYVDAVLCMKCKNIKQSCDASIGLAGSETTNLQPLMNTRPDVENIKQVATFQNVYNDRDEPYMLPKDPLVYQGQWICNHCEREVDGFTILSLVRGLQAEVEATKGMNKIKTCKEVILIIYLL